MISARFIRREELVPGVFQCYFRTEKPLDFVAGQYVDLRLPDVVGDPRGNGRTFTITSLPGEDVSFVYRADEPMSAYKQRLQSLETGTLVQLGDTMGDLVLPKMPTVPLVFVAGGIGMASFTSMLNLLTKKSEPRTVHLFYSLRNAYDDAFKAQVDAFPFASRKRYIKPNYLAVGEIVKVADENSLIYLSGSERFVIGIRDQLKAHGFSQNQVIFDFYDGYSEL